MKQRSAINIIIIITIITITITIAVVGIRRLLGGMGEWMVEAGSIIKTITNTNISNIIFITISSSIIHIDVHLLRILEGPAITIRPHAWMAMTATIPTNCMTEVGRGYWWWPIASLSPQSGKGRDGISSSVLEGLSVLS